MPYDSSSELPANVKRLSAKRQQQWRSVWNNAYSACKTSGKGDAACESEAFRKANGVVKGAEMADATAHKAHEGMSPLQLEKGDKRVDYRVAAEGDNACGGCRFFCQAGLHCMIVEGSIDSTWVCDMWTKPMSEAPTTDYSHFGYSAHQDPFVLFMDASRAFKADADFTKPMWIPFLPKPGSYAHPKYDRVEITKELNEGFVQGIKDHVYQEKIPLDAEHETKLSGAVGWFGDARVNDDGSADIYVEWTDRGQSLLDQGNFKYISPEWYDRWREPASGAVLDNVIIGGAITTRPFFKDKVLRALVASENGGELIASDSEGDHGMPGENKDSKAAASDSGAKDKDLHPASITLTEAQLDERINAAVIKATEGQSTKMTELEGKVTAAEALAKTEKEAREAASTRLAEMTSAERERRFKDLIAGKGGSNDGAPWIGDAESHLTVLKGMVEAGIAEDSETFTKFVEGQSSIAAQAKESKLFEVIGSGTGAAGGSAVSKLDTLVKATAEKDRSKTYQQHYAEIVATAEGRKLYAEMEASR